MTWAQVEISHDEMAQQHTANQCDFIVVVGVAAANGMFCSVTHYTQVKALDFRRIPKQWVTWLN